MQLARADLREEPVRPSGLQTDRGAVAVPAVVEHHHYVAEVPGRTHAAEPRRVRVLLGDAPSGTPAFTRPASVHLQDQFGSVKTSVGAPNLLCLPSSITFNGSGGWTKVVNPAQYAVCFAISPGRSAGADGLRQEPVRCRRGQGRAQQ